MARRHDAVASNGGRHSRRRCQTAAGGVLGIGGCQGRRVARDRPASGALTLVDASTHRTVSRSHLAPPAVGRNHGVRHRILRFSAWVLTGAEQRLVRVDLATRKAVETVGLPSIPGSRLAVGAGSIWLTNAGPGWRIDARTGKLLPFTVDGQGRGIAFGAGHSGSRAYLRHPVDPRTAASSPDLPFEPTWLAYGTPGQRAVRSATSARSIPQTTASRRRRSSGWLSDLAVGGGFVWATTIPDGTIFSSPSPTERPEHSRRVDPSASRSAAGCGSPTARATPSGSTPPPRPLATHGGRRAEHVRYHRGLLWSAPARPCRRSPRVRSGLRISTPKIFTDADPSTGAGLEPQLFWGHAPTCSTTRTGPARRGRGFGPRSRPRCRRSHQTDVRTPSAFAPASASRRRRTARTAPSITQRPTSR